jgi:DNA processing protein
LNQPQAIPARHVLLPEDSAYPERLREINDAPPVLFVVGDPEVLSQPQLAIVGSRSATRGGLENAQAFAEYLAARGLVITSGLAAGIDAAAHRGALVAGGLSVAVAGTGPDRVYPAANRGLAGELVQEGAMVSEFPPGTSPRAVNFPRRNRIISGLSLGVLVVEAAPRSGSLITARLAMEQGREVFAIPGSIHNPLARGCHRLIRDGAKLVETADDILEEMAAHLSTAAPAGVSTRGGPAPEGDDDSEDGDYARLREAMGYDPVSLDVLVRRSGLTAEQLSSMLLLMELRGQVESLPGGRYMQVIKRS